MRRRQLGKPTARSADSGQPRYQWSIRTPAAGRLGTSPAVYNPRTTRTTNNAADEAIDHGETILAETREGPIDAGLDAELVDTRVVEGEERDEEILRLAGEYDAVVTYQTDPRLGDRIFGTLSDRIADQTGDPVIVVRQDSEAADE